MSRPERVVADDVDDATEERSLRDEILHARDEVIDEQQGEEPGKGEEFAAPQDGRTRDHSGRFTRSDRGVDAPAAADGPRPAAAPADRQRDAAQPGATAAAEPAQAQSAPAAAQPAMLNTQLAPQAWTPAGKAIWAQLPEAARAEITRREYEQHRLATRVDEERQVARQFTEVANANKDMIDRSGVHPIRFVSDIFQSMRTLQGQDPNAKAALIRDLAARSGVDLRQLAGIQNVPGGAQPPASPGAQRALPPELIQMLQPLVASSREWAEFKQRQQAESQQREQQEQQQVLDEIVAFRSKPEARFFDAVKDHMVALLQSGAASTLEEAYDAAVWARPDTRAVLETERAQAADAANKRKVATDRARQRGGQVRGGSGAAAPGGTPDRSIRDELKAGFAEQRGRV